jgi:hypothetical protein
MYREDHNEVRVTSNFMMRGIDVFVFRFVNGKREILTSEGYKEYKPFEHVEPTTGLYEEDVQQLFNDLWAVGLRPKTPDEYKAKDEHINDLRKVTFKLLGIDQ